MIPIRSRLRKKDFRISLKSAVVVAIISTLITFVRAERGENVTEFIYGMLQTPIIAFLSAFSLLTFIKESGKNRWFKRQHSLVQFLLFALCLGGMVGLISIVVFVIFYGFTAVVLRALIIPLTFSGCFSIAGFIYGLFDEYIGPGFFRTLLSGVYQRARERKRTILFIDLRNSTGISEKLPPGAFFQLINEFLNLIEMYTFYYDGRIYKYLGDGAILIWPDTNDSAEKIIRLLGELDEELESGRSGFEERFGHQIRFTAGIHSGKVLEGGLGVIRKEIGYWGKNVNIAARLQGACKEHKAKWICSRAFLNEGHELPHESLERQNGVYQDISVRGIGEGIPVLIIPENEDTAEPAQAEK